MKGPLRLLAYAAALNLVACAGVATAQTVNVISAPPGAAVELAMNAATVATTKADAAGRAAFSVDLFANKTVTQTDVRVSVDVCPNLRRVLLVEPGLEALPQSGCVRRDIVGVYLLKKNTGIVVDAVDSAPSVWLRQGQVPSAWLTKELEAPRPDRGTRTAPKGLMGFGGAGIMNHSAATTLGCGTSVESCTPPGRDITLGLGATFWINSFLGAEVSWAVPAPTRTTGSGSGYFFTADMTGNVVNILGKVGVPVGPVRIFGQGGWNYHRVSFTTTEVVDSQTVTLEDGTTQTLPGGTQTFVLKTDGWGWVFGGGMEAWVNPSFALYGEIMFANVKGVDVYGGEGVIDETVRYGIFGMKFRIHR